METELSNSSRSFSSQHSILYDSDNEERNIKWQCEMGNIPQRLSYVFRKSVFTDLTVELEKKVEYKVHKLILAMNSPVFEKMFYGSMATKEDRIKIYGISEEAFVWILEYIYLGKIVLKDLDTTLEIYSFAHEKQMDSVVVRCSKFIEQKISQENAVMIMQFASLYQDEELKCAAMKNIFEKRDSVFASDDVAKISKSVLLDLISSDKFSCSEKSIFQTIYKWSVLQLENRNEEVTPESLREEINPFLPHIHFLVLGSEFFISEVLSKGIFTSDEAIAILKNMNGQDSDLPSFVSNSKVERYFKGDSRTLNNLTLIKYPMCNMSFVYNNMQKTFTDKIIVFKASENILISCIQLKSNCISGSWKLRISDCEEREIGVSSNDYSPWNFDHVVPVIADKCYVCTIEGKGKRSKHKVIDYESCMNGITFRGISITCNINIMFFT